MKTELASVAARYAEAILDLAQQAGSGQDETVASDLKAINEAVASVPEFDLVLGHPSVSPADKKKIIVDLFSGKVSDLSQRLLELLSDKRRIHILPQVEQEYVRLLNERKNIVKASLVSADALSDAAIAEVKKKLNARLGKEIQLDVRTDKSLIGGVVLRLGDQVVDGSLKGKLETIQKALLSV